MRNSERVTAIILTIGGGAIMYYAWHSLQVGSIYVPDAGFLPFLCGAALVILGIVWTLILLAAKREEKGPPVKRMWYRPYASLALMILYAWVMEAFGYITSTFLFVVAWQQIIEREKWIKTIVIALVGTVAMYSLFRLFLKVPIPQELFLR